MKKAKAIFRGTVVFLLSNFVLVFTTVLKPGGWPLVILLTLMLAEYIHFSIFPFREKKATRRLRSLYGGTS